MKCAHCGRQIIPCRVTPPCRGWNGKPCTGWEHYDLFHGCDGGKTCAEPTGER